MAWLTILITKEIKKWTVQKSLKMTFRTVLFLYWKWLGCFQFQEDAFLGRSVSLLIASSCGVSLGLALPAGKNRPNAIWSILCDEASGAIQEQLFSAAFHYNDHLKQRQIKAVNNVKMELENQLIFHSMYQRPTETRCFISHLKN